MTYLLKKLLGAIVFGVLWICSALVILEWIIFLPFGYHTSFSDMKGWLIAFVIFSLILFLYLKTCQCKNCKKFFTIRYENTQKAGSENIYTKMETKRYNNNHEVVGTQEQYVPGTRNYYRKCYVCKKCGNRIFADYSKDSAKV